MRLFWAPGAIEDLKQLRAYIARDNPRAAEIAAKVLEAVERLPSFPASGRPGRVPNTRELVVPGTPLVIPYTVTDRGVEIVAVLHGARRWPVA
ncbi:MAG: type II toxin-antitoxin system RelE/ParE family toxin [Kiloniellales bacterium]